MPPTGAEINVLGFELYTCNDGKIVNLVDYFDTATMFLQLGLMPEKVLAPA